MLQVIATDHIDLSDQCVKPDQSPKYSPPSTRILSFRRRLLLQDIRPLQYNQYQIMLVKGDIYSRLFSSLPKGWPMMDWEQEQSNFTGPL